MKHTFVGRTREIKKLEALKTSNRSEFVAVYGRRRVGKTVLIRKVFSNTFTFQCTGIANVNKNQQIFNFHSALKRYTPSSVQ